MKESWKLGLINCSIPTKFGGLGLGILDECIIAEEIAFGCSGIFTAIYANGLAVSDSMKVKNVPPYNTIVCFFFSFRFVQSVPNEYFIIGASLSESHTGELVMYVCMYVYMYVGM